MSTNFSFFLGLKGIYSLSDFTNVSLHRTYYLELLFDIAAAKFLSFESALTAVFSVSTGDGVAPETLVISVVPLGIFSGELIAVFSSPMMNAFQTFSIS